MRTSAVIPVKSFATAKSRLKIPPEKKERLCKTMFEEVLSTLSISPKIDSIVVVSKDEEAFEIAKKFNAIEIFDETESGVNDAISRADSYLLDQGYDASIVFPQDIPFIKTQDIDFLFSFEAPPEYVIIVPSRRFDGTNALVRMPVNLMKTHYDEDSYKIHLSVGKSKTKNTSLVFAKRIMMDIDSLEDLKFCLKQNEKPEFCEKIIDILQ